MKQKLFLLSGFIIYFTYLFGFNNQAYACGGAQCGSGCGTQEITTGGNFNVETCDVACADADPEKGECLTGSDSVPCSTQVGYDASEGLYISPSGAKTSVCFDGSETGCIGNNVCTTTCADELAGCYSDTGTTWCCDTVTTTPTTPPTSPPAGLGDPEPETSPEPTPESTTPPGCPAISADIQANSSDGPITVETEELFVLDWTSTNADNCFVNSQAVLLNDSASDTHSDSGNYFYTFSCNSACGSANSDVVEVEVVGSFCGDASCSGFETCATCEADCGVCPANFAWWQVWGGHLSADSTIGYSIQSLIPSDTLCIEPDCFPYLSALDRVGSTDSDGFPTIADGVISASEQLSARTDDTYAIGSARTRLKETYSYFYSQYSLGLSPDDDFSGSADDALKPGVVKDAYFHSGDMTIQSEWDVADGESFVIFVDGNLTFDDTGSIEELVKVAEGGFLAFIVSGDITFADSVGNSVLTNNTGNVEGIFIADGTLTVATNDAMDLRFIGEGTFVGWSDVALLRSYNDGADNDLYPAETFIYRPDFVKNTPEKMKRPQMLWQETN